MIRNQYKNEFFQIDAEEWRILTAILLYVFVGLDQCDPMTIAVAIQKANEMIEALEKQKEIKK